MSSKQKHIIKIGCVFYPNNLTSNMGSLLGSSRTQNYVTSTSKYMFDRLAEILKESSMGY